MLKIFAPMKLLFVLLTFAAAAMATNPHHHVVNQSVRKTEALNFFIRDMAAYMLDLQQSLEESWTEERQASLSELLAQLQDLLENFGFDDFSLDQLIVNDQEEDVSDLISDAPSLVPTSAPSPTLSGTLSDMPSMVPSSAPSDTPSMVPSFAPSTPTSAPTRAPSSMPSDFPSVIPKDWGEEDYFLPQGFDVCGLSEGVNFEELTRIQVIYLYRLELEDNADRLATTQNIEASLQKSVIENTCLDASSRHTDTARAHAVSSLPADIPSGECAFAIVAR